MAYTTSADDGEAAKFADSPESGSPVSPMRKSAPSNDLRAVQLHPPSGTDGVAPANSPTPPPEDDIYSPANAPLKPRPQTARGAVFTGTAPVSVPAGIPISHHAQFPAGPPAFEFDGPRAAPVPTIVSPAVFAAVPESERQGWALALVRTGPPTENEGSSMRPPSYETTQGALGV